MFDSLMEKSGNTEVVFRRLATLIGPIKKKIRKVIKKKSKSEMAFQRNDRAIKLLRERLENCGIESGDIVLIHSSLDGLRCLGLSADEIVDFIIDVFKNNTIVFAAYPLEPKRIKDIYKYDPKKTLCWTGILPNVFLKREGVIRSEFPYNTLAAKGTYASKMMNNNLEADVPHGKNTPWEFCRQHHAKILFLGTTSREANTMAIHMVPDIMAADWPVRDWYETRKYEIRTEGGTIFKSVKVQRGFWYRYVNEYRTDRILKENGYLRNVSVVDIPLEIVSDCCSMLDFLIERCRHGQLMYSIPRKYYK